MDLDADYIIAGSGCAGLSLALRLSRSNLPFKKVILIDKERKIENDRTWCFWTKEPEHIFSAITNKSWQQFEFKSASFSRKFDLGLYHYQLIRGVDFYHYCITALKNDKRFEFIMDEITDLRTDGEKAILTTRKLELSANYIFNSAFRNFTVRKADINYLQHFKGWVVETEQAVFDPKMPVFMDFSETPDHVCSFFYLLPYSETRALVEYTGFSKAVFSDIAYDQALNQFLRKRLNGQRFTITETETGKIPMYESRFVNPYGSHVINIGTSGGASKPSTGYTFYFIQKHVQSIVTSLEKNLLPQSFSRLNKHLFYDAVLIDVIETKRIVPAQLFSNLFRKNKIADLLDFLNEESSFKQEWRVMRSVSNLHFVRSALKKMSSLLKSKR